MKHATESYYNWKQALLALPGKMVITDEFSHFEWVGSYAADFCIIILIHGLNNAGQKVAVCGHLSAAESPYSINDMLRLSGVQDILSAHLISSTTQEEEQVPQLLLDTLKQRGVENLNISLGKGISDIAINVKTGEVLYDPLFTLQNAGEKDSSWQIAYALKAQINILMNPYYQTKRQHLKLSVDGRNAEHAARIQSLLETAQPSIGQRDYNFMEYKYMYVIDDQPVDWSIALLKIYTQLLFQNKQIKALPAPPERKMITYPEWEEAKKNIEKPHPAFSSRFFYNHNKDFLIEHRHDNSTIQHEYDKRFGLALRQ